MKKFEIIDLICEEYNKGQREYYAVKEEITPTLFGIGINNKRLVDIYEFFFNPKWKFLETIFNRQKFYSSYMELELDFVRTADKVKFLEKILERE